MNAELDFQGSAYYLDGRRLTDTELAEWRDAQVDLMVVELRELTKRMLQIDETRPEPEPQSFRVRSPTALISLVPGFMQAFVARVFQMTTSAYATGAGGEPFVADWRPLVERLKTVKDAAARLEERLLSGSLTDAQVLAQAEGFAAHATGAFEQSKLYNLRGGFRPPEQPGDKCAGGSRCRCYWEVREFEDRWEGVWRAKNDRSTCDHCRANARKWGP